MTTAKRLGDRLFEARLKDYRERTNTTVIDKLRRWRNADHEDAIVLSRHEVCTLLDMLGD